MTRIMQTVANKIGLGSLFKPTVYDKEYFLNALRKISTEADELNRKIELTQLILIKYDGKKDEATQWLDEVLLNKEKNSPALRLTALECMIWGNRKKKTETLIKCSEDTNPDIRYEAISILLYTDKSKVVPILIKSLDDKELKIRKFAVWYLGENGGLKSLQALEAKKNDKSIEQEVNEAIKAIKMRLEN